jgi:hypothetical protein
MTSGSELNLGPALELSPNEEQNEKENIDNNIQNNTNTSMNNKDKLENDHNVFLEKQESIDKVIQNQNLQKNFQEM